MMVIAGSAAGVFILWSELIGAGWEPISPRKLRRMLELSGVGPSDVVYDLGSGDGRIILEAARAFGARAVGVEADPFRVIYSRVLVATRHLKDQVRVVWGSIFRADISGATVVTLFLTQRTNQRLKSKLLSELKPGTRVVSYVWTFNGWTPAAKDARNKLTLYVVPQRTGLSPRRR